MRALQRGLALLLGLVKTFRLALPKLGVGWMFALLTINFNRITIGELGVAAFAVTTMLGLHYFFSPFQVIAGRFADRNPIWGLRRTPYLLMAAVLGSLIFLTLPSIAVAMGNGNPLGYVGGFAALITFGIAIAIMGDTHHSLIAEVTSSRTRGGVISVVWTFTILSTIIASVIMQQVMPEYTPALMQRLYNLTPLIVIGSAVLGIIGIEKRLTRGELAAALEAAQQVAPARNPLRAAANALRDNSQARGFFIFVFLAIFAIFLQDNILEVFGGEAFGMSLKETTGFQQVWGGGVLIGMILMGIASSIFPLSKRFITTLGCLGTAAGLAVMAAASFTGQASLVRPSLMLMGFFTGFFNVGALSMMMDMTVEGATGLYMGMWGMAQAFGNGASSISSGLLHTGLIETGLVSPALGYTLFFGFEAVVMLTSALIIMRLSVERFHGIQQSYLTRSDFTRAMDSGAVV